MPTLTRRHTTDRRMGQQLSCATCFTTSLCGGKALLPVWNWSGFGMNWRALHSRIHPSRSHWSMRGQARTCSRHTDLLTCEARSLSSLVSRRHGRCATSRRRSEASRSQDYFPSKPTHQQIFRSACGVLMQISLRIFLYDHSLFSSTAGRCTGRHSMRIWPSSSRCRRFAASPKSSHSMVGQLESLFSVVCSHLNLISRRPEYSQLLHAVRGIYPRHCVPSQRI